MELRQYAAVIWKWLWLIVLATLVASVSSTLATRQQPPIYEAKTTLLVGQALQKQDVNQTDFWLGQALAQTYSEVAKRQPVRQATMNALGLSWLPEYNVKPVANTQLLEIQVVDTSPERAAAVASELASQLILQSPTQPQQEQQKRRQFIEQQLNDLEANIDLTKEEIGRLEDALDGMFSARQIADTQNQIAALQQKLNTYQANYAQLLNSLGEGSVNVLTVVEPATVPTVPIGPKKTLTILLAAAIGLILAVSAAFLLEYLDDTLKTPDDIMQALGLSALGAIARIEGDTLADKLITADHPKSPISEAYRVLRTNLQFSSVDRPLKTLLVTSANPIEGKSVTAANIGVVMAQAGHSVIMVDSDLRRPVLHKIFQIPNNEGFTNALLHANPSPGAYLQPTKVENLRVLTTGPLPPNPSELLGSERMKGLIEHLKSEADVVIFDSPPSLAVTDAAVLAMQMDGTLLVVDAGATRRGLAGRAVENLQKVGGNVLGVVLNKLSARRGGYYYHYYYYYSSDSERTGRRKRRHKPKRGWLGKIPFLRSRQS
ncbi:MAG: polysaccharide biosynthesis tyrosine autokinase [Chloroflexi bacterium]|nr:polysaccharide biosynthesis tyrosine autokinase [Chloroflexota bacterium]